MSAFPWLPGAQQQQYVCEILRVLAVLLPGCCLILENHVPHSPPATAVEHTSRWSFFTPRAEEESEKTTTTLKEIRSDGKDGI